jgi:hypothetical protein
MTRRARREDPQEHEQRTNWTLILLLGGLVLLILIVAYLATARDTNPDRLTNSEVSTAAAPDNEKLCAGKGTYELIKAELFRQAAQLRGSDQQAYDQLSGTAVVRMENPVMESENSTTGAVNCSGSISLDLPPGIAVADGRRTLMSDIDYSVQPGSDGASRTVVLGNAEAIVGPLSKLVRVAQAPEGATESETNGASAEDIESNSAVPETANPISPAPAPPQANLNCANAKTRSEALICSDPGLAALDRTVTGRYSRALDGAAPDQRILLRDTARRFTAFRDRCTDRQCVADAYVGRMREIRDIMEGNWQPPR